MSSKRAPKQSSSPSVGVTETPPKPSPAPEAAAAAAPEPAKKGKRTKAEAKPDASPTPEPAAAAAPEPPPEPAKKKRTAASSGPLRGVLTGRAIVDYALEKVLALAVCPKHAEVAVANRLGKILALDIQTGERLREYKGHEAFVGALSFSPDGDWLLSSGNDKTMRVWGSQSGDYDHDLSGIMHASPRATTMMGQMMRTARPGHGMTVLCVTHGPNGLVGSGGQDRAAKIWKNSQIVRTFDFHEGPVTAVAFRPDAETLLSASEDRALRLWDQHDGRMVHKYNIGGHDRPVRAVVWLNAQRFVSSDDGGQILLWDADKETVLSRLQTASGVRALTATRDGAWIFAGSDNGQLLVILAADDALSQTSALPAHKDIIRAVALDEDLRVLVSGGHDGVVRFWDIA